MEASASRPSKTTCCHLAQPNPGSPGDANPGSPDPAAVPNRALHPTPAPSTGPTTTLRATPGPRMASPFSLHRFHRINQEERKRLLWSGQPQPARWDHRRTTHKRQRAAAEKDHTQQATTRPGDLLITCERRNLLCGVDVGSPALLFAESLWARQHVRVSAVPRGHLEH